MKNIDVGVGFVAALLGSVLLGMVAFHPPDVVAESPTTCSANGRVAALPTGTLTADDQQRSARALEWLTHQTRSSTPMVGGATIATAQHYPTAYTGSIAGTFQLNSSAYQVASDASIAITSPTVLPDDYAGTVHGKVLTTPTAWRWIIQVYKEVDGVYTQVPKQALADASTGEFSLDLSDVQNPPAGKWAFGILDAAASYAPYGGKWPAEQYYQGLEVQLKLVTDGVYDWATTQAMADGTYNFSGSNTGVKMVRLVDTATHDILAETVPLTGLIRSYQLDTSDPLYGSAFAEETFVYDQAVALFAALSAHDETLATHLVDGMLLMQETSGSHVGSFVFAAPQLAPEYRASLIRTGAHAIATDALLAFIEHYPDASEAAAYKARAALALAALDETYSLGGSTQGLYLGGYGDYSGAGGSFAPNVAISWASTEHNIDIWHTLMRASRVFEGGVDYREKATQLHRAMQAKLFNAAEGRYNQGMTAAGPDTADPLDVHSWGAVQLYAAGDFSRADTSLGSLAPFQFTRAGIAGYAPFYDSSGYPGAAPNVWYEGTFGAAMAYARGGQLAQYRIVLDDVKVGQEADGAFRYATDTDATYEISRYKSVASTAWYILATTGLDTMWNTCLYTAPAQHGVPGDTPPITPSKDSSPSRPVNRSQLLSPIAVDKQQLAHHAAPRAEPSYESGGDSNVNRGGASTATLPEPLAAAPAAISWVPWAIGAAMVVALSGLWWLVLRRRTLLR